MIYQGDCLEVLKGFESNSIDSLVTDPPAGISFMGKEWDHHKGGRSEWVTWMKRIMQECLRVLKPGAYGLVWALPRTSHWTATALEDAGFEVRDVITHLFGQGFPKSLDVSKAIDKAAGAEREVVGSKDVGPDMRGGNFENAEGRMIANVTAPTTDSAKQWQGWGTALKPASEHWILVRNPCSEKTVAANVQKWGTGALNIDASRITTDEKLQSGRHIQNDRQHPSGYKDVNRTEFKQNTQGRFPANLVLSHSPYCTDDQCDIECAILQLDAQSGVLKSGARATSSKKNTGATYQTGGVSPCDSSAGGASRFFYCAKISSGERNAGLDGMPWVEAGVGDERPSGQAMTRLDKRPPSLKKNHHPTVKPKKLMSYLIRMITPPSGIVLDPFMGSGSTGIAAKELGFDFIGIEKEQEYFEIAQKRIEASP